MRAIDTRKPNAADAPGVIELVGVSKRYARAPDLAAKAAIALRLAEPEAPVRAVDRVSLSVGDGEAVGLVGESGCGKSTLGRIVTGLIEPSEGDVLYHGQSRKAMSAAAARAARLKVQMIFQDPFASLNPRMRVADIVGEAPRVHGLVPRGQTAAHVDEVLTQVGLDPSVKSRYPHQFSGGQRQRVGIARALAVKPEFLVCDEAVAALDVSIQAKILNLLARLRAELGLGYLFISHDLGVVRHVTDRVMIMYLGRVVEAASTEDLFSSPLHPYTEALLANVPSLDRRRTTFHPVKGEIPSPAHPPPGCHFHPRCVHAFDRCRVEAPKLLDVGAGRTSACHLTELTIH